MPFFIRFHTNSSRQLACHFWRSIFQMLLVHSLNLIDDLVIDKQIMINTTTDIDIIAKSYFVLR